MRIVLFLAAVILSACGADGEPEPVEPRNSGVSITGTVGIGVSGTF